MYKYFLFPLTVVLLLGPMVESVHAGLVAYWPMDEGAGTTVQDVSGHGASTQLAGNAIWGEGRYGAGVVFDGMDSSLTVDTKASMSGTVDFTVCAWIKTLGTGETRGVIIQQRNGGFNGEYQLSVLPAGTVSFFVYGGGYQFNFQGTTLVNDGQWHHVVGVRKGLTGLIYIDGVLEAETEGTLLAPLLATIQVGIGKDIRDNVNTFNGTLDEVRIYDHAISVENIAFVMNNKPQPYASQPVPEEDAMVARRNVTLQWLPGEIAVSHRVYISASFEDANNRTVDPVVTSDPSVLIGPGTGPALEAGTTYYWRVSEVDADGTIWPGPVWSFWTPSAAAWNPTPANGVHFVHPDQDLSWNPGFDALIHTVYFGTSFDEVNNATIGTTITDTTYDPRTLEIGKTYYWRVDEFSVATGATKGDVWSFTTLPDVAVTDPNLTLWWSLDEGQGITAVDWSGHGHHGTISGGAQWTNGYQGTALTFGNNTIVEATGYPGITGAGDRSCCAWIRTTLANRDIMSWGTNAASKKWRLRIDATGGLRIEVNGGYVYGVRRLTDGRWHHVALTFANDGTPDVLDCLLYVDGELESIAASQAKPINTTVAVVRIGEAPWNAANALVGEIDDARIYDKALTVEELQQVIRGNILLATDPEPGRDQIMDIRNISSLNWTPGDTAVSHDVYFGSDGQAVTSAGKDAPEYKGNRTTTSFLLDGLVDFAGGDYYWRVDEVESDGTVHKGAIWKFTLADYLIVDDFENYDDDKAGGTAIYQTWSDGWEDLANGGQAGKTDAIGGTFGEVTIVNAGSSQSLPLTYDNMTTARYSEIVRTWASPQDWTLYGVNTLTLYVRGLATNVPDRVYVTLEDSTGAISPVGHADPNVAITTAFAPWEIPFSEFTGVNPAMITKMYIGLGDRNAAVPGGMGTLYIDDIRATKLEPDETQD